MNLHFEAPAGITVEPADTTIPASATPEVPVQIQVPADAPLGEYPIHVTGTPTTGAPTSIDMKVKVVAPKQ